MNATLQCFCHIEKFISNFKYNQHIIDLANKDKKSLTYSFKSLIEKLWPNNYADPYFNETLSFLTKPVLSLFFPILLFGSSFFTISC